MRQVSMVEWEEFVQVGVAWSSARDFVLDKGLRSPAPV